jgi:hypothetical protein
MNGDVTVRMDHSPIAQGHIQGFRFFWAFYVNGLDRAVHCQLSLRGSLSRQSSTRTARSGQYTMNERRSSGTGMSARWGRTKEPFVSEEPSPSLEVCGRCQRSPGPARTGHTSEDAETRPHR